MLDSHVGGSSSERARRAGTPSPIGPAGPQRALTVLVMLLASCSLDAAPERQGVPGEADAFDDPANSRRDGGRPVDGAAQQMPGDDARVTDSQLADLGAQVDVTPLSPDASERDAAVGSEEGNDAAGNESLDAGRGADAARVPPAVVPTGPTFYVNSETGNDDRDGRAPSTAWKTLRKVNATTFEPGSVVRLHGTFTDVGLEARGNGTEAEPILFVGEGPFNGRARLRSIRAQSVRYRTFRNFEASSNDTKLVLVTIGGGARFVRFENLRLVGGNGGAHMSGPTTSDVTFVDTIIDGSWMDGVLLTDNCGDRFSYIGGSITNTGDADLFYDHHGVYASGGHGHLFDGVLFHENRHGSALSLRRGNTTVRNCVFDGQAAGSYYILANWNEDEGSVSAYTGRPSKGLTYWVYRNLFIGPGKVIQGTPNDDGVENPGNTWVLFNNTFIDIDFDFDNSGESALSRYYGIYLRNNLFVRGQVNIGPAAGGQARVFTHNAFWNTSAVGSSNVAQNPALDGDHRITASAFRDVGTANIAPSLTLSRGSGPQGYTSEAPDIGREER